MPGDCFDLWTTLKASHWPARADFEHITHLTQSVGKEKPFTTKYTKEHKGNLKSYWLF
jgi:hypothetical protein